MSIKFLINQGSSTDALIPITNKVYEKITIDIEDQTDVSITTGAYDLGYNQLEIYLNGLLQYVILDYIEINETTVRFILPLKLGDELLFIVRSFSLNLENRYYQEIIVDQVDQVIISLDKPYITNTNSLQVYLNGLLQRKNYDYIETDKTTITFTSPLEVDWVVIVRQD